MKILRLLGQGTLFSVAKARFEAVEVVDILNSSPCLAFSNHSPRLNVRLIS